MLSAEGLRLIEADMSLPPYSTDTLTPEELAQCGAGSILKVIHKASASYAYFDSEDAFNYTYIEFMSIGGNGSIVNNIYRVNKETGVVTRGSERLDIIPQYTSTDVGKVLTISDDSFNNLEWAEPQSTTYTAGTGIDITNGVISCTFVDANSEGY